MTLKNIAITSALALSVYACVEFTSTPANGEAQFRADAEKGNAFAQAQLGQHYLIGQKGPEDTEKAVYRLGRAAAQNEAQAVYLLGVMREKGQGFKQNLNTAFDFYMRAAKLNNGPAQNALARFYAYGMKGPIDNFESYKWQILSDKHDGLRFKSTDYKARRHLSSRQIELAKAAADDIRKSF